MKLIEALQNVDKSKSNSTAADFDELADEFGLSDWYDYDLTIFDERMKGYYVLNWMCTDQYVGMIAYYLDGDLVGGSYQPARKSHTHYEFVSKEAGYKVRDFLLSMIEKEEHQFKIIDMEEEIEEFYSVQFTPQLLTKEGLYSEVPCKYIKEITEEGSYVSTQVLVEFEDGTQKIIDIQDFKIPLHLTK